MTFVLSQPIGVTTINPHDQRRITHVYAGDDIRIRTRARLRDGGVPTPDNSVLRFTLADQLFDTTPVWVGRWRDGIEPVAGDRTGDLIEIQVPLTISAALRRGSFTYSLIVADKLESNPVTVLTGDLLVEYTPGSPQRSIPYKDQG